MPQPNDTQHRCTGFEPSARLGCKLSRVKPQALGGAWTAPAWASGICPSCGAWTEKVAS